MMQGKVSRPFEAKWPGTCKKCGKPYAVKDPLHYEGSLLTHVNCPKGKSSGKSFKKMLQAEAQEPVNIPLDITEEMPEVLAEPKKPFVPSPYQQAAADWATQGQGNAVMPAVAGSGKTTTIVWMLDLLPRDIRILFVAFNKSIVRALKDKIAKAGYTNITVQTLNGCGFTVIRKYEGFQKLEESKVLDILTDLGYRIDRNSVPDPVERRQNRIFRSAMKKVVEMVKSTLIDFQDANAVMDIITRYHIDVDEELETKLIEVLPEVMKRNNEMVEMVDFNDQCYLPVVSPVFKNLYEQYDFILCDEFQDFNRCNIEFILKCLAPEGRIIAVGDHRQSLYGFRGADTNAIPSAIERLHATVLPLSISYRCPRSHVERIKGIVPEIEPAPNAKEGIIEYIGYKEMLEKVMEGDMVVCRTNAPLVKPAFALIKAGRKAIIRGKDIGKELVNFIERFQTDDLGQLDILMQEWTQSEVERWLNKNKEMMAEAAQERYNTIIEVAKVCRTVAELVTKIQTLFSDDNIGEVFSSVHRAKGLEAPSIFLYRPDLMPHPKAKTPDELQQEDNCIYVAGTRSLENLYLVSEEKEN